MQAMAILGIGGYTQGRRGMLLKQIWHRVVLQLVEDDRLQNNGYVVVTDKFYSSLALFSDLVARAIGACGTERKNRRGLPSAIT